MAQALSRDCPLYIPTGPRKARIIVISVSLLAKPRPREVAWLAQGHPATGGLHGIQTRCIWLHRLAFNHTQSPTALSQAGGARVCLPDAFPAETSGECPLLSLSGAWAPPPPRLLHEPVQGGAKAGLPLFVWTAMQQLINNNTRPCFVYSPL